VREDFLRQLPPVCIATVDEAQLAAQAEVCFNTHPCGRSCVWSSQLREQLGLSCPASTLPLQQRRP